VTRLILIAFALSACSLTTTGAQDPPPVTPPAVQPPAPVPQPPSTPTPAKPDPLLPVSAPPAAPVVDAPGLDPETYKHRRSQIEIMEGVLMGAVRGAALEMANRLTSLETGNFVTTGALTAKGFILDGYGVFFHVEIPGVQPTVVSIESIQAMRERLSRPRQPQPEAASSRALQTPGGGSNALVDPASNDAEYVELVTQRLIDAMVRYSMALELQPHEWFTVAAGDGDTPVNGILVPRSTMILRVRGSDIADYMTKKATLEQIRKKIDVRRF